MPAIPPDSQVCSSKVTTPPALTVNTVELRVP
jgi:hypothetical protein